LIVGTKGESLVSAAAGAGPGWFGIRRIVLHGQPPLPNSPQPRSARTDLGPPWRPDGVTYLVFSSHVSRMLSRALSHGVFG
jgi:hypothetical protein